MLFCSLETFSLENVNVLSYSGTMAVSLDSTKSGLEVARSPTASCGQDSKQYNRKQMQAGIRHMHTLSMAVNKNKKKFLGSISGTVLFGRAKSMREHSSVEDASNVKNM